MTTWYLSKWRGSVTCTSPGLKNRYGNWLGWMSTCRNISTRTLFYRFCLYHESYYSTIVHTPTAVCLPAGWFKIWYAYKTISPSRRFKKGSSRGFKAGNEAGEGKTDILGAPTVCGEPNEDRRLYTGLSVDLVNRFP